MTGDDLEGQYRGFHSSTDGQRYLIRYEESDWHGAQKHTVLHETFEIIGDLLRDLYPGIRLPQGWRLCRQADLFAAAVLMQPAVFDSFARTTGFDVLALGRMYRCSYASLTLRLAEVVRDQPLLAALYQRREQGEPAEWSEPPALNTFRASVVAGTPGLRFRTNLGSRLTRELPLRGRPLEAGSAVERVVSTGKPVFIGVAGGEVVGRGTGLALAARPVMWQGHVAKVALVAVPWAERSVLAPDLGSGPPAWNSKLHQAA